MGRAVRNPHVGGQALPLLVPQSDWSPPAEFPDLRRYRRIAIDTEDRDDGLAANKGPGWTRRAGHVCGVSAAWPGGSLYAPIRHPDTACLDRDAVRRWLADLFASDTEIVFQNAHFDVGWLLADLGLPPPRRILDTTCQAFLVDENLPRYDLTALCEWRGLPGKDESLLRDAAAAYALNPKADLWRMPARYVGPYAEHDAVATLALSESLDAEIAAQDLAGPLDTEMRLVPMVVDMMRRGVRVDLDVVEQRQALLRERRDAALADLSSRLRRRVGLDDVRSARWLEQAFDAEKLSYERTGKTGQGKFESKVMRRQSHWLPRLVAAARDAEMAAEKFLGQFIAGHAHRGRLHASVHQYLSSDEEDGERRSGTRSHRFSYSDPPLQQMPNRDEGLSSLIRGAFLPEESEVWGSFDLSQQEYRLIVHFAAHLGLRGAGDAVRRYVEDPNTDFHRYVVDITGLDRDNAKTTNFAKVYGAGVPKFASMIGRPIDEAGSIYAQYDRELPFVSRLADVCQKTAERRGHVTLVDGARSHFTLWEVAWLEKSEWGRGIAEGWPLGPCSLAEAERRSAGETPRPDRAPPGSRHPWSGCRIRRADSRKAMNRKIQGSGARQLKLGMVGIHDAGHGGRCLLQMHDELCFSLPRGANGRRIGEQIRGIMVDAVRLSIPMRADAEFGRDWGRARKTERLVNGVKVIEYGATWDEAEAEIRDAIRSQGGMS